MASIRALIVEAPGVAEAERFYAAALPEGAPVRVRASDAPTSGFRGCTVSLLVAQPGDVDLLVERALQAGATTRKAPAKSMWGYGGVVQAPDGTTLTVASASKRDSGPATGELTGLVLQLGVDDVAASKRFYVEQGLKVARSFGKRYVEFDTGDVTLTLNGRAALAKTIDLASEGSGSHRLVIAGDGRAFVDPDGFIWEVAS